MEFINLTIHPCSFLKHYLKQQYHHRGYKPLLLVDLHVANLARTAIPIE